MAIEHLLNTKFSTEVPITLEMLEELGVFSLPTELLEISGQASSEASLEALLHKVCFFLDIKKLIWYRSLFVNFW